MQKFARIGPIAFHLPETVEDNDQLQALFPKWDMELIYRKTGVRARHIAAAGETAADLAVVAVEKLFQQHDIDRHSIDFLLLCTQSPDYPLPTTACLLQDRLKLPTSIGALDFNLGCSGFVYGLSVADGLIRQRRRPADPAGHGRDLLEIHPSHRSVTADDLRRRRGRHADRGRRRAVAGRIRLWHRRQRRRHADGSRGRPRPAAAALKPRKRKRWPSALVMDGPEIVKFTLEVVPAMIQRVLDQSKWTRDDVEFYLMHQATQFMLDHLRVRLDLPEEKMPLALQEYGNTVSSTLPLLMHDLRAAGRLRPGTQTLLVGFGVGLSWAGCSWTETWQPRSSSSAGDVTEQVGVERPLATKGKIYSDAGANGKHAADAVKAAEGT